MTARLYHEIDDTVYFWFAANDTSGSGGDGATPLADVRLAGAAASAVPVLSPTPILLSSGLYPDGCYELAVAATTGNGFSAGSTYAVFCTLAIDSQNPTGFIGSFTLAPVIADVREWQTGSVNGLISGRVDVNVGVLQTAVVDATAIATDAIGSAELSAAAAIKIADAILQRDMDQVEGAAPVHSLCVAILKSVSHILDDAGVLKTFETDGTTLKMSQTVTTDASADPIDELTAGV